MSSLSLTNLEKTHSRVNELEEKNIKIKDLSPSMKSVDRTNYSIAKFDELYKRYTKPKSILPFRVSFETIGIDAYTPGNPPPIGIAIIGVNNYIL